MSPYIHSRLFALQGMSSQYEALDILPLQLSKEFNTVLTEFNGFNVTVPFKEQIIPYIDFLDESAKKYGAVNCVKISNGKAYACSTDAYGFTKALQSSNIALNGKVLVLGAGGAARTIAREAADMGCSVTIAARRSGMAKADYLKDWICSNNGKACSKCISDVNEEFDICVNATPSGMYPNISDSPITESQLSKCKVVFDAVYNPSKTVLLKSAEKLGIKSLGGMSMLVWQAAKSHSFWYGAQFDTTDINNIITDACKEMRKIFNVQ